MVLLENDSDWLLVQWAAKLLADEGKTRLIEALALDWLSSSGRGGTGELLKSVKDPPQKRCIAIIDSDRDDWKDPPKRLQQIESATDTSGAPVHILRARELENYVAEGHWSSAVGRKKRIRPTPADRGRENQIWGKIRRFLENNQERLRREGSQRSYDKVIQDVANKTTRQVPKLSDQEVLLDRQQMSPEQRAVDDIKARLTKRVVTVGVNNAKTALSNSISAALDTIIADDLRKLAILVERWL